MKVTIEKPEKEKQEIEFPCLMGANDGCVVLFDAPDRGVYLGKSEQENVFTSETKLIAHTWSMKDFMPLPKGTKVIIEQ